MDATSLIGTSAETTALATKVLQDFIKDPGFTEARSRPRKTPAPCSVPGCKKTAVAKDLCETHRKRAQRKRPLDAPVRERIGADSELVQFQCPADLRAAVLALVEREGITESEWWRRAGRDRLKRQAARTKREA